MHRPWEPFSQLRPVRQKLLLLHPNLSPQGCGSRLPLERFCSSLHLLSRHGPEMHRQIILASETESSNLAFHSPPAKFCIPSALEFKCHLD